MSLEELSKSPAFANSMQTDDSTRGFIAQFFGDPEARTMVQQAGGIQPALKQIDNPMSFTPQRGLAPTGAVGNPSSIDHYGNSMARVSNQPATPAVDFSNQNIERDIANLPPEQAPLKEPPASGVTREPVNAAEYGQQNPDKVAVPGRPTVAYDNMTPGKKALFLAFAGLGKFGDNLSGRNNSYLDQFMGNTMKEREAQQAYDQNLPAMRRKAETDAYENYLKNRQAQSNIAHTDAETADLTAGGGPRAMAKANLANSLATKLSAAWESGKYTDPERFRAIAHANGAGLDPDTINGLVDTITQNSTTGPKYDSWNENGVPVGLKTPDGRKIPKSQIKMSDPDQKAAWDAAQGGYMQSRSDKKEDQAAMMDRFLMRPVPTTDLSTGIETWDTGKHAVQTHATKGVNQGVNKAKSGYAISNDVMTTANVLHGSIPQRPLDTDEIAKLAVAVKEYHGPIEEALKSNYLAGMKPDVANLAANMLAMRDNIITLPAQLHIQPSDGRIQSLWNALPSPGDFKNPALVQQKMANVYRMIINLRQALPGEGPEQFGIEGAAQPAVNPSGGAGGGIPMKAKRKVGNAYQYTKDGGKTWSNQP